MADKPPDLSQTPWNIMKIFIEATEKEEQGREQFIKDGLKGPPDGRLFFPDEPVRLQGISSRPEFNGVVGKVGKGGLDAEGRLLVRLPGGSGADGAGGKGQKVRVHPSRIEPILGSAANTSLLCRIRDTRFATPGGSRWPPGPPSRALGGGPSVRVCSTAGSSSRRAASEGGLDGPPAKRPDVARNPAEIARRAKNATTTYPAVLPRLKTPDLADDQCGVLPRRLQASASGPVLGPTGVWQVSTVGKRTRGWSGY
mmetsp:Transcript_126181/g.318504  ORF Transcript_126181/g.318504 Transcript_126181/m.318504 type:complete len:255 (+) Transcript_126181:70-834(+)